MMRGAASPPCTHGSSGGRGERKKEPFCVLRARLGSHGSSARVRDKPRIQSWYAIRPPAILALPPVHARVPVPFSLRANVWYADRPSPPTNLAIHGRNCR